LKQMLHIVTVLIPFCDMITVYSQKRTKLTNVILGRKAEFLVFKQVVPVVTILLKKLIKTGCQSARN
jgi:hypothetical protein